MLRKDKKRQNKSGSLEFEGCKLLAFRCSVERSPRESPRFGQKRRQQQRWETATVWQWCHFSSSPRLRTSPVINCAVFPHHVEHWIQISPPLVWRGSRECVTEVGGREWLRPPLHKHKEFECGRCRILSQDACTNTETHTHTHMRTPAFSVLFWMLGMNVLSDRGYKSARTHSVTYTLRCEPISFVLYRRSAAAETTKTTPIHFISIPSQKATASCGLNSKSQWPSIIFCVDVNCQCISQVTVWPIFGLIVPEIH